MKNYSYLVVDAETQQAVIVDPAWEMETIEQAFNGAQSTLQGMCKRGPSRLPGFFRALLWQSTRPNAMQLLKQNIYLQFADKHSFAAFRLRSGQSKARHV